MAVKDKTTPDETSTAVDPKAPIALTLEALQMLGATIAQNVVLALKSSGVLDGAAGATQANLGEVIGNAVADGMTKSTRRTIRVGEYLARLKQGRPILQRRAWQNDKEIPDTVSTLSNREIELLNGIHRTGRYIDRLVEVVIGLDGADEVLYFRYNDKGDHKFALSAAGVRNFQTMLEMIMAEQAAEDAAEESGEVVPRQSRRRSFGSGKHTRAAELAAAE